MLTEGEIWARDQLGVLRRERFNPRAVAAFFAASQRRAGEVRSARPGLARRERAWAALGAGAWLSLAALGIEPFRGHIRSGLTAWGTTVVMLDWHLGMLETEDGRLRTLGGADALTLSRAWLVPAVAARPSGALLAVGFATDVLDGRVARRSEPTRLGRDLEGVVDAAFGVAAIRGAIRGRQLARCAGAVELVRVAAGFAYGLAVYFGKARPPDRRVLAAGRATTPLRACGLIVAAAGRRRLGSLLLGTGSAAAVAALGFAARPAEGAPRTGRGNHRESRAHRVRWM